MSRDLGLRVLGLHGLGLLVLGLGFRFGISCNSTKYSENKAGRVTISKELLSSFQVLF